MSDKIILLIYITSIVILPLLGVGIAAIVIRMCTGINVFNMSGGGFTEYDYPPMPKAKRPKSDTAKGDNVPAVAKLPCSDPKELPDNYGQPNCRQGGLPSGNEDENCISQ